MNKTFNGTTEDRSDIDAALSILMDDKHNYSLVAASLTSIAELLDNIYEHAVTTTKRNVNWMLVIESKGTVTNITVTDDGCGIPVSIMQKCHKDLDDSTAIKFAIGRSTTNGRGLGLLSIKERVKSRFFKSLEITSLGGKYQFFNQDQEILSNSDFIQGTKIRFVLNEGITK